MGNRKDLLVFDIPIEVKDALLADAEARNVSLNEMAVVILAEHYKVKYIPSGVPFKGDQGSRNLAIRGGAKLHRKIDIDRARRGGTLRGIVLERLSLYYGIPMTEPIGRRRPRRTEGEVHV